MAAKEKKRCILYTPETEFLPESHYYTKVLNANLHPLVKYFMTLSLEQIITRYVHMKPQVNPTFLRQILTKPPANFQWGGADLFYTTDLKGSRSMIIVETNSCPSGQKSFPYVEEKEIRNGYYNLLKRTFVPALRAHEKAGDLPEGGLAVLHDKNPVETHGYAVTLAHVAKEPVYCVEVNIKDPDPPMRWVGENASILEIRDEEGVWHPIRAAFRYVTQKPWSRLPVKSKSGKRTFIMNPSSVCLSGGRNKLMADKAYEFFNLTHYEEAVQIRTPTTVRDLYKNEIPLYIKAWGGIGVVKVPYSNAGQGVYCILNPQDLDDFMKEDQAGYDQYIVQQLVGNASWSSRVQENAYYHLGLVPDARNRIYCADLRMMISYDYKVGGYKPLALYARRALDPLIDKLEGEYNSWNMLGTNLSVKLEDGGWTTDTSRLMIMDHRDFNRLGLSLDDLIEGFFQTVFAMCAIDRMSKKIEHGENGAWDMDLFRSLNNDPTLISEILQEK